MRFKNSEFPPIKNSKRLSVDQMRVAYDFSFPESVQTILHDLRTSLLFGFNDFIRLQKQLPGSIQVWVSDDYKICNDSDIVGGCIFTHGGRKIAVREFYKRDIPKGYELNREEEISQVTPEPSDSANQLQEEEASQVTPEPSDSADQLYEKIRLFIKTISQESTFFEMSYHPSTQDAEMQAVTDDASL